MKVYYKSINPAAFLQIPLRVTEKNGVAYFQDFNDARDHGQKHGKGYPAWRVVSYWRGFAVQAVISGPYFGKNGELS
jgi:hypothetical protein